MDKQVDENNPQEPGKTPDKMIAPEDVTYSQHDEKQKPIPKSKPNATEDDNASEDESYLDKNE